MTTQGPITVYNKRLGKDRRELYHPTRISAASYSEAIGSRHGDGQTENAVRYKLRIPADADTEGKGYVPEAVYRAADDAQAASFWTLGHLDLIVRGEPLAASPAPEKAIRDAAAATGRQVIVIEEYADDTERGSPGVRHWRIGGR